MLAKAANRKRAVEYLAASGAVPISVTERGNVAWLEFLEINVLPQIPRSSSASSIRGEENLCRG
jgi:hypothetical protein